jgi:hypothetical protein
MGKLIELSSIVIVSLLLIFVVNAFKTEATSQIEAGVKSMFLKKRIMVAKK